MAGVQYGPIMKPSTGAQQKRSFAADITNAGTTTGPPKKKYVVQKPSEKQYVGGWSKTDRASSEPHSDATEESQVVRRTYDLRLVLQRIHAPDIAEDVTYYEHVEPNAVEAVKARQSGEGVTAVLTAGLQWPPLDGGVAHAKNVPMTSSDVVGLNEGLSAAGKKGNEMIARQKQGRGKGGPQPTKGTTFAPSFSVWFNGELVGKYKGAWKQHLSDIKQKRPGEKLTHDMLQCLLNIKKDKLISKKPYLKKQLKDSKFTAEYDD